MNGILQNYGKALEDLTKLQEFGQTEITGSFVKIRLLNKNLELINGGIKDWEDLIAKIASTLNDQPSTSQQSQPSEESTFVTRCRICATFYSLLNNHKE